MLPKFSRRKRTVEDKGTYRQGRLAMQVRQCGFWQIILPYKKRWALREIKAHEPILDDPRRRGTSEEKKKAQRTAVVTQTKRLETRTVPFRVTLLYHRKGRMNRTLSH